MPTTLKPASALPRIARAIGARPWVGLVAWVILVGLAVATAIVGVTGETLSDRLKGTPTVANSESAEADDIIAGAGGKSDSTTLLIHGVDLDDPALIGVGGELAARLDDLADTSLADPLAVPLAPDGSRLPPIAPLIADDERGVLYVATVLGDGGREPDAKTIDAVFREFNEVADAIRDDFPTATVEIGGTRLLVESIVATSENDLRRGETVALPIAFVVMLIVFGGFIAAGVPLIGAITAIVGSLGALFGFSYLMDIDTTVVNVITAVGLGLSIDYGLLVVSRFREEYRALERGASDSGRAARRERRLDAIARTANTAGRTVVFSGITFAIACVGLLVFEPRMVRAIGIGALSVTVIAIASALTLIPALLGLAGDKLVRPGALTRLPLIGPVIDRFGDIAPVEGAFSRLTRLVQKRPAVLTLVSVLALLVLASPAFALRIANTSVDALPVASTQHTFVTTLNGEFPEATSPRVALVTDTQADATAWAGQVESIEGVESVGVPRQSGDGWITAVRVEPTDGFQVVAAIRSDRPDFDARVTGLDARTFDLSQSLIGSAPWAALIIAAGTITLLFLMTGSLVVPLKALAASALSLGASIGVLAWGFQQGNLAGVMNFDASNVHGIDVIVLVLSLAFGFGLAMDYEMFILSRIKEAVDSGIGGREAVARGLQRSGRIITSAALIIIVVFAGFATGDLMVIKQLGVALAVAVLVDSTLVRLLLVPAFMTWQLRIMWWAPKWMKALHARFGLRES